MFIISLFSILFPLYDVDKTFTQNIQQETHCYAFSLFNYLLNTPLGIPACAIMTSKGISVMAKLGFSVFTYKTIRSSACAGHSLPNICLVCGNQQLQYNDIGTLIRTTDNIKSIADVALANSFGNNALSLEESCIDIAKARAALSQGQILIVSIFGSDNRKRSCVQDFVYVARAAVKAGAHIIEANLSCPNLGCTHELYKDETAVFEICAAIVKTIHPIPLIIKVGVFDYETQMRNTLIAAAQAGARGVCGINTIPMRVQNELGMPYFGADRFIAGVSGNPIKSLALEFVKAAKKISQEENLNLVILATGGITAPEHFDHFLNAGATIAMSASGAMYNPNLAFEYLRYHN